MIKDNIKIIRDRINKALEKSGRTPNSVKLVAVSKTKSVEDILEAVNAGQFAFGENYAQELRDKAKEVVSRWPLVASKEVANDQRLTTNDSSRQQPTTEVEWHFIGHLQKNKIKYVLPVANWIHTIDSAELLEEIGKKESVILSKAKDPGKAANCALPDSSLTAQNDKNALNCLIEVNIANEPTKSGIAPDKVFPLVEAFSTHALKHLDTYALALKGLMCMAPGRSYFKKLKYLLDEINSRNIYPEKLTELSMGMSNDFEIAIEEGATIVRIGTAIFGER